MAFTERPYQTEALEAILQGFRSHRRQLLVLPTGAGKTITFSRLIDTVVNQYSKRVLVLAHREELLTQAQDKLASSQGISSDLERAEHHASLDAQVVVASVQSLYREKRLHRFPPDHFALIIIDEAHRTLAKTYMAVLDYFDAKVLGVTATPDRGDKKNLGQFYENVAYEVGIKDLIDQEYLAPIRMKTFPIDVDLSQIKVRSGDYDSTEVANALEPLLYPIAEAMIPEIEGRHRTLVFLPLCDLSRQFTDILCELGVPAAHVDGESKDRKEILEAFGRGDFKVLNNAMLLTEGYDEPIIDTVMCLRPTRSRGLYSQMVGRGTRLHPEKDHLLVLDPLWCHENMSLVKPAHLVAENPDDVAEAVEMLQQEDLALRGEDDSVDLMDLVNEATQQRMEKLADRLREKRNQKARKFDPVSFALANDDPTLADYEPAMGWEKEKPSDKQLEILEREGFVRDDIKCRGQASKMIDSVFARRRKGLASTKQFFHLQKMGVKDAQHLTFEEAKAELDRRWGNKKGAAA